MENRFKIGDIMICNETYTVEVFTYKKGDILYVLNISPIKKCTFPLTATDETGKIADCFTHWELETKWLTLAEWRDKQINSILEDEKH